MRLTRNGLLAVAALGFAHAMASANPLGIAADYNAFVFTDTTELFGASQGAFAVGGNATIVEYNVASSYTTGTNLVVGGNLTLIGGSIQGNAIAGGDVTMDEGGTTGDTTTGGNFDGDGGPTNGGTVYYVGSYGGTGNSQQVASVTLPIDFTAEENQLTQTSDSLNILTNTGSYTDNADDLVFTGTETGQNIFSIDDSVLMNAVQISIDIPIGATAVINVTDSTGTPGDIGTNLPNADFEFDPGKVLWNFNGFDGLSIGSFSGSILAPSANVTLIGGSFDGTIVAYNLLGVGESLNYVPLPASVWTGLALLGGLALYRRRVVNH